MKASFVQGFSMINMPFELYFKEVSVFLSLSSSHPHCSKKKTAQTCTVLCEENTNDSLKLVYFPKALTLNTTLNSNALKCLSPPYLLPTEDLKCKTNE